MFRKGIDGLWWSLVVIVLQIYDIVIAVYECFRAKIQMRSVRVCSVLCPLASQLKFSFGVDFVAFWAFLM